MEKILSLYPQVIKHELYHGYPINELQISWMKLDCTHDGSLKGICMEFFEMLDNLVGTEYYKQYTSPKVSLDTMIIGMSRLCISYNVGVLIIDEIQNLCSAKKDIPVRVLNFFVTLVNKIGVPVILIGTPKALSILQSDFQQAKRGSGQGDAMWHRLENGRSWNLLRQAIWEYQYTKKPVPFNDEMNDALYEESQGIPFLAVHIYKLVQEDAILSGRETFSAKDLHRIASEKMKLTEPMRNAMKLGKDVDLRKYVDITPFSYSDYKDNYSIAAESKTPAKEPPKVHSVQEAATVALTAFGISYAKASSCVCAALAEDKSGCPSSEIIARKAYDIYLSESTNAEVVSSPLSGLTGYDALKEAGVIADEIP